MPDRWFWLCWLAALAFGAYVHAPLAIGWSLGAAAAILAMPRRPVIALERYELPRAHARGRRRL